MLNHQVHGFVARESKTSQGFSISECGQSSTTSRMSPKGSPTWNGISNFVTRSFVSTVFAKKYQGKFHIEVKWYSVTILRISKPGLTDLAWVGRVKTLFFGIVLAWFVPLKSLLKSFTLDLELQIVWELLSIRFEGYDNEIAKPNPII